MIRNIKQGIRSYAAESPENSRQWDLFIYPVLAAIRSSVQSSTGYAPFNLVFGREMQLPADHIFNISVHKDYKSLDQMAKTVHQNVVRAQREAAQNQIKASLQQKTQHDKTSKLYDIKKGDYVLYKNFSLKSVGKPNIMALIW